MDFKPHVRTFADFPEAGQTYYDTSPLLASGPTWHNAIGTLSEKILVFRPDVLVGVEIGGALLAAPVAHRLACGFVLVSTTNKLPGKTRTASYDTAYGKGTLEAQLDLIKPGQRVVILNDILASGGTMQATINLLREIGADVQGAAFLVELTAFNGRSKLDVPYYTLMTF